MSAAAIGAGASVVGGIMQMIAARQAQAAIRNAIENEMTRQAGYRNQAFGTLGEAIPQRGVETARSQMAEGAANRRQAYEGVNQASLGFGGGQSQRDRANYSLQGDARAKLGSYSDWQLRQLVSHIRTQDKLNKISNFAGGQAQNVFPYVLHDSQHKGDELAALGQLIAAAGGTATSFGSLYGATPEGGSRPGGTGDTTGAAIGLGGNTGY
jgi:hypothetical protein